jgi:anti-sigma regulatory factor (Ser/Thr protein kinase)
MQQPDSSHTPVRLRLARDHAQLARLEAWLHDFSTACELPARASFGLELVLTEAVTNVMDHSHNAGGDDSNETGEIEVICTLRDGCVSAELIDDGPPFDPTSSVPVVLPANLDEASPGGLGIHLMRRYTSSMEYVREQNRNVLRMTLPVTADAPVG